MEKHPTKLGHLHPVGHVVKNDDIPRSALNATIASLVEVKLPLLNSLPGPASNGIPNRLRGLRSDRFWSAPPLWRFGSTAALVVRTPLLTAALLVISFGLRWQSEAATPLSGDAALPAPISAFVHTNNSKAVSALRPATAVQNGQPVATPVTPNAARCARSLLSFLADTYGKNIISGQQDGWRGTNELSRELTYITDASGHLPALLGMDVAPYTLTAGQGSGGRAATGSRSQLERHHSEDLIERAKNWYLNSNGIVCLCWHWAAPMNERAFYTKDTKFDPARAVTEGTPEYQATLQDIDLIAAELKLLRDSNVPILWRPLHEANGRWFWWGAAGPDAFKKLWRMMFERLTIHHHLNNLIWVFSPGAAIDLYDWYPGDAYVDIIAPDHYPMDGNHEPAKSIFDEMVALGGGSKLVGFGENGPLPRPADLVSKKANWLFFLTWSGRTLSERNTPEEIKEAYSDPYVVKLGDLPDLKHYGYTVSGEPKKLSFSTTLPSFPIANPNIRPMTVTVVDGNGNPVREPNYAVTVSLEPNHIGAKLLGNATLRTVNGIAAFPNLAIDRPGDSIILRASANGLEAGISRAITIGPGNGITREIWNTPISFPQRPNGTDLPIPDRIEVSGRGLESPFCNRTNYAARYRGYLLPPETGEYKFWLANEGASELWLSTDASETNCVKLASLTSKTPYAKWPHTREAESQTVHLQAGKRYFLEVRHRQSLGSTHLCVCWRLPSGAEQRPLPSVYLASFQSPEQTPKLSSAVSLPGSDASHQGKITHGL